MEKWGILFEHRKELSYYKGGQTLENIAQRDYRVSFLKDIQTQLWTIYSTFSRGVEVDETPEVPSKLSESGILSTSGK